MLTCPPASDMQGVVALQRVSSTAPATLSEFHWPLATYHSALAPPLTGQSHNTVLTRDRVIRQKASVSKVSILSADPVSDVQIAHGLCLVPSSSTTCSIISNSSTNYASHYHILQQPLNVHSLCVYGIERLAVACHLRTPAIMATQLAASATAPKVGSAARAAAAIVSGNVLSLDFVVNISIDSAIGTVIPNLLLMVACPLYVYFEKHNMHDANNNVLFWNKMVGCFSAPLV